MQITVEKITGIDLMRRACEATTSKPSNMSLDAIYRCEHSPIRTQLFWVEMRDIPTFVSVHFVRHNIGVTHFVSSNREDRGGNAEADRNTPVNHSMLINAQALINMARKRLCGKAAVETQYTMFKIMSRVKNVDESLARHMVPECVYRGKCHETKPCNVTQKGGVNVQ